MSEVELTIVTMQFDASDPDALQSVLAKYTVMTRMDPGCRNIDLCASVTSPGRFVIVQKWDSPRRSRPISTLTSWSTWRPPAGGCCLVRRRSTCSRASAPTTSNDSS